MGFFKYIFLAIIAQLEEAGNAVEYVSWITAGIFAVLAVFTIFLAHQFQTNTVESIKILWKIRQSINEKKQEGLQELFQDFDYFNSIPKMIKSSLQISKVIIYFLVGVWGFSGIAKIVGEIKNPENNVFPLFSILLIGATTILFVFFSIKLVQTIKQITNEKNKELPFKSIKEIKSYPKLNEKGYNVENAITLDNPSVSFDILSDEPYLITSYSRRFGFSDFAFMFNVSHPRFNILLGNKIQTFEESIEIELSEQSNSSLNRIFTGENLELANFQICFFVNDRAYSFNMNPTIVSEPLPTKIHLNLAEKIHWDPPIPQRERLLNGEEIEIIEPFNT